MKMDKRPEQLAKTARRAPRPGRTTGRSGFTLIELLVVIALIAVLLTLVLSGLNRATKSAKRTASQRSAAALAQAVDQFRNEFGFLPPLVHDGPVISAGSSDYRPQLPDGSIAEEGPIIEQTGGPYLYKTVVVWSPGLDFHFLRRRSGTGADNIDQPSGGSWSEDGAWDDRRYSKYSLAYYLVGALEKDVDGVRGPGFARPIDDGSFLGVGYPLGSVRDRFEPFMDVDRRGVQLVYDYVEPREMAEHDPSVPGDMLPDYEDVLGEYDAFQRPALTALVDAFGNAFRYYRWEPGRYRGGRLTTENILDLNIPPVLLDPVVFARVQNDEVNADLPENDLLANNTKLRDARYAIVSAGPDGFFGTESIESIAAHLRSDVPSSVDEQAALRREVWADNAVEVGN